jgi:hypothetical protein
VGLDLRAVSPNGRYVAADDGLGGTVVWDLSTGQRKTRLSNAPDQIGFSRDSQFLIIVRTGHRSEVRLMATGHIVDASRNRLQVARTSSYLDASGRFSTDNNTLPVTLIDALTGDHVAQLRSPGEVTDTQFSPDGAHVLLTNQSTARIEAVPQTRTARVDPLVRSDSTMGAFATGRVMGAGGGRLTVGEWVRGTRGVGTGAARLDAAGNVVRGSGWQSHARWDAFGLSLSAKRSVMIRDGGRAQVRRPPRWDVEREVTLIGAHGIKPAGYGGGWRQARTDAGRGAHQRRRATPRCARGRRQDGDLGPLGAGATWREGTRERWQTVRAGAGWPNAHHGGHRAGPRAEPARR